MKYFISIIFVVFFGFTTALASLKTATEQKVSNDLNEALNKIIPKESFLVQVNVEENKFMKRQLIEGETIVVNSEKEKVVVPPLPGFQPKVEPKSANTPSQSKQVFRMVEQVNLKRVNVQLIFHDQLANKKIKELSAYVRGYLQSNYPRKFNYSYKKLPLMQPKRELASMMPAWESLWPILFGILAMALLGFLLWSFFQKRNRREARYPTILDPEQEPQASYEAMPMGADQRALAAAQANGAQEALPDNRDKKLVLPSGGGEPTSDFPSLPATENFITSRSELLKIVMGNAEIFRYYYKKLSEAAQSELYAGLRGPAFDTFLDSLDVTAPAGASSSAPPSEEQMEFYRENFFEYIETHKWQSDQFFGFLNHLGTDQLEILVKQENPLIGALVLKFLSAEKSAAVLGSLDSAKRKDILIQSSRLHEISTEELLSIENSVRMHVERIPKFLLSSPKEDLEYWTGILTQAEDQESILLDLENTRPELYPHLVKFRFKLEDAPSLPKPLLAKVLDEVDNEELAMALASVPKDISDFILNEINRERAEILKNHLMMYHGLPENRLKGARQALTHRFREVMV